MSSSPIRWQDLKLSGPLDRFIFRLCSSAEPIPLGLHSPSSHPFHGSCLLTPQPVKLSMASQGCQKGAF